MPRTLAQEKERYIPGLDFVGSAGFRAHGYSCTAIDGAVTRTLTQEKERYIPGLDFVGSAGFRAHGYSSVMTNGYQVAQVVLAKLGGAANG